MKRALCLLLSCLTFIFNNAQINGNLASGSIGSSQSICYNTAPLPICFLKLPSGGTGSYTYQWQRETIYGIWSDIPGATLPCYSPPVLYESTFFRCTVTSGSFIPVNTNAIFIKVSSEITAQLFDNISIAENTSTNLFINISGGYSPYAVIYTRNEITQTTISNYTSGQYISTGVLKIGVYIYALVSVTDTNGCQAQIIGSDIDVTVTGELKNIPDVFTPNGDGINETWIIPSIQNYPDAVIRIYDRNLKLIILFHGSDPNWDGRDSHGNPMPIGAYLYGIDLKNGTKPIKGYISIVR